MTTYFVTRHAGAQEWARRHGFGNVETLDHLDAQIINSDDIVIGALPPQLAAAVIDRGGAYHHLIMDVPATERGKELSADDMERFGARVQRFMVAAIDGAAESAVARASEPEDEVPTERETIAGALRWARRFRRWSFTGALAIVVWWCADSGKTALKDVLQAVRGIHAGAAGAWPDLLINVGVFVACAAGVAVASYLVYKQSGRLLRPIITAGKDDQSKPRQVVVLALSAPNMTKPEHVALMDRCDGMTMDEICFDAEMSKAKFNWQQPFRALRRHTQRGKTTRVFVITSPGERGSHKYFERFHDLATSRACLVGADLDVRCAPGCPVDFDDYPAVERVVADLIETLTSGPKRVKRSQISLDATGGNKITGIAAAVVSMNRDLEFTYVPNGFDSQNPRTLIFDAEIEAVKIGQPE
jgi:CRISPR-associated protein Csx16